MPAGLSRDGEPVFLDLDFLDGTRGAHVNISGICGVATKTTYALFLLYALFHSKRLGAYATNTKAIVFNVKGEDLLWLDRPNARPRREGPGRVRAAGPAGRPVRVGRAVGPAPPGRRGLGRGGRTGGAAIPHVEGRAEGVTAYYWTVREFVRERYLRFLFAEADDERSQIADLVARVESLPRPLVPGRPRGAGHGAASTGPGSGPSRTCATRSRSSSRTTTPGGGAACPTARSRRSCAGSTRPATGSAT